MLTRPDRARAFVSQSEDLGRSWPPQQSRETHAAGGPHCVFACQARAALLNIRYWLLRLPGNRIAVAPAILGPAGQTTPSRGRSYPPRPPRHGLAGVVRAVETAGGGAAGRRRRRHRRPAAAAARCCTPLRPVAARGRPAASSAGQAPGRSGCIICGRLCSAAAQRAAAGPAAAAVRGGSRPAAGRLRAAASRGTAGGAAGGRGVRGGSAVHAAAAARRPASRG